MPSPTFDNSPLFDSKRADNSRFSEGVLYVQNYTSIRQRLHFSGEDGDRYINHGYPDLQWTFRGMLSAPSLADLKSMFDDIQSAIDDGQDGNYQTLVDSFGNTYEAAQVHAFDKGVIH